MTPRREDKSVGAEETFETDVDDPEVIRRELLRLSGRTARGLRKAGCVARTVSVKLRLASFKTITRSKTLGEPTDVAHDIYAVACALYEGSGLDRRARLRLVGVRASGLRPVAGHATQLAFGDRPAGWREAEQAMDRIARRFGDGAVRPAALVPLDAENDREPDPGTGPEQGGKPGNGPEPEPDPRTPSSKGRGQTRILGNEPGMQPR